MSKTRQVQISAELWEQIVYYFAIGGEDEELYSAILAGIDDKIQAQIRRELYTQYKTAPTTAEQEAARQAYLDKIGMNKDFRQN